MFQKYKRYFLQIIIIVLCGILLFNSCNKNSVEINKSTRDTIFSSTIIIRDTVFRDRPILVKSIKDTILLNNTIYIPSNNYDTLLEQFQSLRETFLIQSTYEQTSKYDSSEVTIIDTIQQNQIKGRSILFNLKYPIKTNTITVTNYASPKNKVYIGGELGGNKTNLINLAEAGLLFQNKSDNIYKASIQVDFNGVINYKIGKYWKIKLKK
jgi:hypothetical protein